MFSLAGYSWLLSVAFTKSLGDLSFVLYGWLVRFWIYSRGQAWVGRPRWRLWLTRELLTSGKINRWEPSQRPPFKHQNQVHLKTNKPQFPDAPCQSFNKTETQPCTLEDRLPKAMPNAQTPQNSLLDKGLCFKGTRSSSIHQNTGTRPSKQETCTRHWPNFTSRGKTSQLTGTKTFQPADRRP